MRTKYLLTALAIPALFAACADDEFATSSSKGEMANGQLIELEKDFAIGLVRGEEATTKTTWHYEGTGNILYSWLPTFTTEGSKTTATPENIGFAWRGETGDAKVRTNYKFTLDGFLKKGETAPSTKICNDEVLVLNGYTLNKDDKGALSVESDGSVKLNVYDEATQKMVTSANPAYTVKEGMVSGIAGVSKIEDALNSGKLGENDPYVRNGIFTTSNSTIFKGDYIVYFPYDPTFAEVDYLPATSPVAFTQDDKNDNRVAHLAGKTFGYGTATISKGGSMAESFTTRNLSSIVDFKIKAEEERNIQKIIFVDEGENAKGFVKKVGLDAAKIAAGNTGADLYVGEAEYEPTVVLTLHSTEGEGTAYATVGTTAKEFTIAVLPTTLVKPVVYLMNEKGLCLRKELDATKKLVAGSGLQYSITIGKNEKFDQALAVDTKTLFDLLNEYGRETDAATINVLGNITLDGEAMIDHDGNSSTAEVALKSLSLMGKSEDNTNFGRSTAWINNNVTVNGTGTITIPADLKILVKVVNGKTLTINNPVVVEGKGCCGTNPGMLMLMTANSNASRTSEGNVVFNGAVENYGDLYLGNTTWVKTTQEKQAVSVTFNETLLNGEDKENETAGVVYCLGLNGTAVNMKGDVTNEGTINVISKTYDLETLTLVSPAANEYQIQSVKVGADKMTNKGSILVGAYTKLSVAGDVANSGDITVNTANTKKDSEDGELYIASTGAITNTGLVENYGVINNEGSLRNNDADDAVIVDHVGCQFGGSKAQAIPGEYICDVEDEDVETEGDRLEYAMGENMPTTTIRFVGNAGTKKQNASAADEVYTYNLGGYKTDNILNYNFIIATGAKSGVKLIAERTVYTTNGSSYTVADPVTINGKLTVETTTAEEDGKTKSKPCGLELSQIQLTVNEAVNVKGELKVSPTSTEAATLESVNAFVAQKDVTVSGKFEVAQFAKTALNANLSIAEGATATFDYATYTNVANNIAINGTFTRVVSTGNQNANPAQVWCATYTRGAKASIPNGLPQTR